MLGKNKKRCQYAINKRRERGRMTKTLENHPFLGRDRGSFTKCCVKQKRKKNRTGAVPAPVKNKIKCPALAVGTRLKPARNGRWVASVVLHASFFQPRSGGLQSTRRVSIPFKKCGFKRVRCTHRAGHCFPYYVVRGQRVTLPRPRRGSS